MHKLLPLLFLSLATINCQNDLPRGVAPSNSSKAAENDVCSSTPKVVKVPQEFPTIDDALSKNKLVPTATSNPTPATSASPEPPTLRLVIEVAYKAGGYLLKDGLTVARPCTDIIGIAEGDKKPILHREEFGEYEQPVIKLAASNVLLRGFEIKGKYTTKPKSGPLGVLVLIREEEKHILGYANISIEDNEIHSIGYQYPADQEKCWEGKKYICGGGHGIEIKSNNSSRIERVTVRGNKIHDLHLGQSEALTIANNVHDFTVTDNEIYQVDNIGIDIAGFQDDQSFAPTKGKVISNRVYESTANDNPGQLRTRPWIAGIYIDGGRGLDLNDGAILIERNVVYDHGFGIDIGSEKTGEKVDNVIVQNNLIFKNWIVGIGVGHNDDEQRSYVENCLVKNNTLYQNKRNAGDDPGELRLTKNFEKPFTNVRYENNLIVGADIGRCLLYAKVHPPLAKFDLTFANNLFVGNASKFWDCEKDFQQFNTMTSISLQNNEFRSDFPFEKELPDDPKLIVEAIRTGTIKDFFRPKAFAVGKGIAW